MRVVVSRSEEVMGGIGRKRVRKKAVCREREGREVESVGGK